MSTGTLFVVATPIGNIGDMTARAMETLRLADAILCEDTRVTGHLLSVCGIKEGSGKLVTYHQHSSYDVVERVLGMIREGRRVVLVSDAGTPGISDPGNELIHAIVLRDPHALIVPIPGVSAVMAALSVSGFQTEKFLFLGFPPHKKKRGRFFKEIAASEHTAVLYESNHRVQKTIGELAALMSAKRRMCVCRELTKKFESIYRGTAKEILQMDIPQKGEFVIVVEGL